MLTSYCGTVSCFNHWLWNRFIGSQFCLRFSILFFDFLTLIFFIIFSLCAVTSIQIPMPAACRLERLAYNVSIHFMLFVTWLHEFLQNGCSYSIWTWQKGGREEHSCVWSRRWNVRRHPADHWQWSLWGVVNQWWHSSRYVLCLFTSSVSANLPVFTLFNHFVSMKVLSRGIEIVGTVCHIWQISYAN